MLSPAYATPLHLDWRPCPRVAAVLSVVYAGAILALWLAPLHWAVQTGACAALVWRAWADFRRHVWLSAPDALVGLAWDADGRWWLHMRSGESEEGVLCADAYVSAWLVVLAFNTPRGRRGVLLHAARTAPEGLRRLRVRLRIKAPTAAGSPVA